MNQVTKPRGVPMARLGAAPQISGSGPGPGTGYPWHDGELLYAADLNAAIGGGASVAAINPVTGTYGIQSFPSTDIYQSPDSYAMTGSMTIRGQPYGYYDTGTLLSLVSTTQPLSSSRAGVCGGFEAGVAAMAAYGGLDLVTLYGEVAACPPPLVLHNVTYDATHIIPHPPLTAAQIKVLRKNMWVMTNSIDTTVSPTPAVPNGYRPTIQYCSYVTGWAADGTSISVVGWTVPGSGHTAAGQVPPVGVLDPGAADATAYFGAPTNVFGGNIVMRADPVGQPDSRIKTLQGLEIDYFNYGTTDYQIAVTGLSMQYTGIHAAKPTADSYGLKMSSFPNGIIVNYTDYGLNIAANVAAIIANAFNAFTDASPAIWAGSPTTNLICEAQSYIDTNLMRLQCWSSRDVSGTGWATASIRLGLRVDGTPMAMTGGTLFSQIVWNPPAYESGMQLISGGSVAGLTMDVNGFIIPHVLNAANDAAAASAGVPIGAMYRNGSVLMVRVA